MSPDFQKIGKLRFWCRDCELLIGILEAAPSKKRATGGWGDDLPDDLPPSLLLAC